MEKKQSKAGPTLLGLNEKIKEERKRCRKLTEELAKFRLAVDNALNHIIITDSEGVIIYANKAVEQETGYSPKEIIGKTPRVWGKQMSQSFYEELWRIIKTQKKHYLGEITNRKKNGEKYLAEVKISPIVGKNRRIRYFVGIENDITKLKEVDRAKTEFVSLASHQLKTPLSIINWYAESLLGGDLGKIPENQKKYLDEIYKSNKRMIELVNALLNVSRIDIGTFAVNPKMISVKVVAESEINELKPKLEEKHLILEKKYAEDVPEIFADPKLLRIIFQNLLSNSIKYTPPKGGKISFTIERSGAKILITVSDNGYGIPKHQQKEIFNKFFRADNAREIDPDGTGLGLYVVKAIVKEANGKIWLKSEENKGATFFVSIPIKGMKKREGNKDLN